MVGLSISSKQHPQYLNRLEVAICDFQSRYYEIELLTSLFSYPG